MLDYTKLSSNIRELWRREKIVEKLLQRKGAKFFFLDGPPYANAVPHVGHAKNTAFKDVVIRKKFMEGHRVYFKPGFDTHGLPIENMVEKQLGLQSKKDIEAMGAEKFMAACKKNAALNKDLWMEMYAALGCLYAEQEPYLTYTNEYIESGWWAFSEMYKKGLVYHGERPVMWCPHCETSLSGYEVTDSYKDVSDLGVYVLFRLEEDERFVLAYTTTPWTLPANVAIAVAPKEMYATLDITGKKVVVAEARLPHLSELGFGYHVLKTELGKKLVGKKYAPLLDVPLQQELATGKLGKAHEIIASIPLLKERVASKVKSKKNVEGDDLFEEFVTVNEGTGFVHTAPGHGKTDYLVGKHYRLAHPSPVDEHCYLKPESGFSGFVKKADKEIIERLKVEEKLLHTAPIVHKYPLCWRCKSQLIFRLSEQLFLKIDAVKKIMLRENKKVRWMPPFARERLAHWVENAEDWNISRQRYWGIPIPLWRCSCGEEKAVASKGELERLSGRSLEDLHLAEQTSFPCTKCGAMMHKMHGILDVWFDSGVAPWASFGYPRNNKELFEQQFPADWINEAQDQIRGWFYSLMFCSAAVFGKTPYKAVSMTGWVIGKDGDKLSKSAGNAASAKEAIEQLGADVLRYYFCSETAPYEVQRFNPDAAKREVGKIFMVLLNLLNLASNSPLPKKPGREDAWILSRLESLTKTYGEALDAFEMQRSMKELSYFIVDELSRGYVQMTREREQEGVIARCMKQVTVLLAPVAPFLAEHLWQQLRSKKIVDETSVHLSSWPRIDKKKINKKLETEFALILKLIELGLAERDKAKIGLRWPLASATVSGATLLSREREIIEQQLNVKQVLEGDTKELAVELDTTMTPALEAEGFAREIMRKVQAERKNAGLQKGDMIELTFFCESSLARMLEPYREATAARTNAKKISFVDGKMPEKAIVFTVRERKIGIFFS